MNGYMVEHPSRLRMELLGREPFILGWQTRRCLQPAEIEYSLNYEAFCCVYTSSSRASVRTWMLEDGNFMFIIPLC